VRRKRAFPLDYNDELETAKFKAKVNAAYSPELEYFQKCFEASRRRGTRMGIEQLLRIHRVGWEYLTLWFAGLPPKQREELADQLVPFWIKYKGLRAQTLALAERALAEMGQANG
jgi:hypothetical protein